MEGKRILKPYYYFPHLNSRFSLGALPLGFQSPIPPNQEKFCDRVECTNMSDIDGHVLICGHAYHENCFRMINLRCQHCFNYLSRSIDELTDSYNQRLHMEDNINSSLDLENIPQIEEDSDLDGADKITIRAEIDKQLQERISGIVKFMQIISSSN